MTETNSTGHEVEPSWPVSGELPPDGCPVLPGAPVAVLHDEAFAADPGAVYARLREFGKVAPVELAPGAVAYLVVDSQVALDVLRNPHLFRKNPTAWTSTLEPDCPVLPLMAYQPNVLFEDGIEHDRYRAAVADTLAAIDAPTLRGFCERSADEVLSQMAPRGRADLVPEYALQLPLRTYTMVFGCPPDLARDIIAHLSVFFDGVDRERAGVALQQCMLRVADLVRIKRAAPGADLVSHMIAHPAQLTDDELVAQLTVLIGAGIEPEMAFIANALLVLMTDERFGSTVSGGALPVQEALDEVLWTMPPMANYGAHYPVCDITLAGVVVPAQHPVLISYAACNTDPDLARHRRRFGHAGHLAWSAGPHACPAQQVSKVIASVGVERLLDVLPDVELSVALDQVLWRRGPFLRAPTALPVRFPPRPGPSVGDG